MHTDNLSSTLQYTYVILKGSINYESMFLGISRLGRGSWFPYDVFEKDDPKLPRKRKVSSYYEEEEAPVEFASKVEEYYHHFLSSDWNSCQLYL